MAHEEDAQKSGTFTAYKRHKRKADLVELPDLVELGGTIVPVSDVFGYSVYDAKNAILETDDVEAAVSYQELPHLVELPNLVELAGTIVPVSDVFGYSVYDAKKTMPAIFETDEVAADGGVKGREADPFCFNWTFYSPSKDHNNKSGISGTVLEAQSETTGSAVKRRRILHFDDDPMEIEPSSIHDFINDPPTLPDDLDVLVLDLYAKKLYADCINDRETHPLPDDSSFGSPEVQMDVSEYLNLSTAETETIQVMRPLTRSSANIIFKGKKSFAWLVPKLTSSFIYPFGLVKPCGVDGDMTLKDINQNISSIQAAKPKEDRAEPPVIQTSAFSGKPVVRKTKFCTGGKGSITVMRTRG